ncbi:hypothetical protein M153_3860004552 [Pseudoloma neurophilia]|uniref:Uncharacterized protein n=1 Tax=Pseudoloma neurophilia TaxID=146866 RepID=A0A0R0LXM2_9MICR|nr:hypothetical protein M153_3860004552 [Pseudoloma neurophilia]
MIESLLFLKDIRIDEMVDDLAQSDRFRLEKFIVSLFSVIPYLPGKVLQFSSLLSRIPLSSDLLVFLKSTIEDTVLDLIKKEQSSELFNVLRFLYVCEYANLFTSNLEELLDELDVNILNLIINCAGVEKRKLLIRKREKSFEVEFKFSFTDDVKNLLTKKATQLAQNLKNLKLSDRTITENCSNGDVFIAFYIIQNFHDEKQECISQMTTYFTDYWVDCVLGCLIFKETVDMVFVSLFFPSFYKSTNFLANLYAVLEKYENGVFKNRTLAFIYNNAYKFQQRLSESSHNYDPEEKEIEKFRSLITKEVAEEMGRVCKANDLRIFLPEQYHNLLPPSIPVPSGSILHEIAEKKEFRKITAMDESTFFQEFCKITSPSISHFLTYLEIFQEKFEHSNNITEFFRVFKEYNKGRSSYLDITCAKMKEYGLMPYDQK